jgi:hypothetical protein
VELPKGCRRRGEGRAQGDTWRRRVSEEQERSCRVGKGGREGEEEGRQRGREGGESGKEGERE